MKRFKTIFHGMAIGIANIIPGVSGGTIAVVLNIYDQLISAISEIFTIKGIKNLFAKEKDPDFSRSLSFLMLIGIGALLGIFGFAHLLDYSLNTHNHSTMMFFIGLIVASIPIIYKAHTHMSPDISKLISFLAGGVLLTLTFFVPEDTTTFQDTTLSLQLFIYLFISGFIAAGSMVVPGISGSLMLLLLGSYHLILTAVSQLNVPIICVVGIGAATGVILFTKLINFFLQKYPSHTYYFILGLLIASLPKLWPGLSMDITGLIGVACLFMGFFCAKKCS